MLELLRAQRGVDGLRTIQAEGNNGAAIDKSASAAKYKSLGSDGDDELDELNLSNGSAGSANQEIDIWKRANQEHPGVDIVALPASGSMLQTLRTMQRSRTKEKEHQEREELKQQAEKRQQHYHSSESRI
jgi:hypothetical protein